MSFFFVFRHPTVGKIFQVDLQKLHAEYTAQSGAAALFLQEVLHQFDLLIRQKGIKLGVSLEGRVKQWESITEKLERKSLNVEACTDISDLIGLRAITLFKRDQEELCKIVSKSFKILSSEDKMAELEDSRFGYLSRHFHVKLKPLWKKMPSFAGSDYALEIQVRTLSQHMWAAASHALQYKNEQDVPSTVSRSIHRVAALLETVDLEFERVLGERMSYTKNLPKADLADRLNVDNLTAVLNSVWPKINRAEVESYSDLLEDLSHFKISTVGALKIILNRNMQKVKAEEAAQVERIKRSKDYRGTSEERSRKGVFFSHVGLTRKALSRELGADWENYSREKSNRSAKRAREVIS